MSNGDMMHTIERLETRRLFSVDTSSVALVADDGSAATLDRHKAVLLIAHGANMTPSLMEDLAQAAQAQLPSDQWQVLLIDWSKLASGANSASKNALAVGDRVVAMLRAARIPAARVNLVGFSMGGTVVGRVAADLKTQTTEVNRVIGIDPADGKYGSSNYAADSAYSIAFCGRDSYGGEAASLSADDSIVLTGLSSNDLQRHADTESVVTTMWQRDAGFISAGSDQVSTMFSLAQIMDGPAPTWKKNQYDGGFEAEIACGFQSGEPNNLGPLSMDYIDRRGRARVVG